MYGTGRAGSLVYSSYGWESSARWGIKGQTAFGSRNRDRRFTVRGGQASKRAPLVGARLEDPGLREAASFPLEVVLEERQLDVLAVELGRLGDGTSRGPSESPSSRPTSRRAATAPSPATFVAPGSLLLAAVRLERAEEVLGVEPAADRHDRRLDVLEVRPEVARLPEVVVRADAP